MNPISSRIWRWLLIYLLPLSLGLVSCSSASADHQQVQVVATNVKLEVEPNPPEVGPSHLTVTLTDPSGAPIEGADLEIEGMMNHDGMQPRRAKARAGADGTYEAPFVWAMGGDWTLTVTATFPDGRVTERQFKVMVKGDMSSHNHHGDDEPSHPERIANEGAVIRLVSPQDGAIFEKGSDVEVEIEYDHFNLGEEGQHWHLYIDDQPGRMIMGNMTEAILRDLAPGQHQLSAYLSVGGHEELKDGAAITITIAGAGEKDLTMSMDEHQADHTHEHKHE